jgi:hypothetical protein
VEIFLARLATLRKIAGGRKAIGQASGEESTSMLEGNRIMENVPEISADLG